MNTAKTIEKNIGLLLSSQVLTYIINFFYTMVTARYLGAKGFGILSFALVFTGIFNIFADLGIRKVVVRDMARSSSSVGDYFKKIVVVKVILVATIFFMIVFFINILEYPTITKNIVYILGFSVVLGSISDLFFAVFQSQQKIAYESFGQVLRISILMLGALLAISMKRSVNFFAYFYLISNTTILLYCCSIYILKYGIPNIQMDKYFLGIKVREAIPFGLIGIFEVIYHWISTVMLSIMKGDTVVGWYNAAYRLFLVTLIIPSVFNITIFPVMSYYYISSQNSLKLICVKYFKYLTIIGMLIGMGITLFSDKIILLVFGKEYKPSIIALQILIWTSVLIYINSAFIRLFESINRQVVITRICGYAALINIIFNLALIPKYSYIGSSFAIIISELLITILVILSASRTQYRIEYSVIISHLFKVFFSAIVFGLFAFYISKLIYFPIAIILAIVIYFALLYMVKAFDKRDLSIIKSILY